jgi:hypothetical protein
MWIVGVSGRLGGVSDHIYVARFGLTPRDLILLPFCILAIVVGTVMVNDGQMIGALAYLIGGGYLFMAMAALVSRRVALAVTAEGITLGLAPPWPASRSAFVPWSDIEAVILWRQDAGRATMRYIGVVRRADAPPLPGSAKSSALRRINKAFVPRHLSEGVVADSRQISFWRLNKTRLTTAVNHFRPDVPVVDHT